MATTFTDEQQMLTLALASYQGIFLPHLEQMGQAPSADLIAHALATLEPLGGSWVLAWGPASHRPPGWLLDDVLVFVARDTRAPNRYAVVIRGTNPVSVPDWIFGDLWVARSTKWAYGDADEAGRISLSTSLGLSVIQSLRTTHVENDHAPTAPDVLAGARGWLGPLERSLGEQLRGALRSALSTLHLGTPTAATGEHRAELWSDAGTHALAGVDAAMRLDGGALNLSLFGLLEDNASFGATFEQGVDLATFLRGVTQRGGAPEVWVTGHSKGAALATVVSLWLADTRARWDPDRRAALHCVTFASPTAGDRPFVERANRVLGARQRRVANRRDLVTLGWSRELLQRSPMIYAPSIPMPLPFQAIVERMLAQVEPLDYEHVDPSPDHFEGDIAEGADGFFAQVAHQHLEAYIAHAKLDHLLNRERLFGILK